MSYAFGHLALFVTDLRAAEDFYRQVFGMEILFREAQAEDGLWYTLAEGAGWEAAERAGAAVSMVALRRDDITLPIFEGSPQHGTIVEIGVRVPPDEIAAISSRLPDTASRLSHEYDDLMFSDPFGYTWHINASDDGFMSNGEIGGLWLET